jgi:3-dehydroquinate dehydratase
MNVVVIAPFENVRELDGLPEGVRIATYSGTDDLLKALRDSAGPAVLWSDSTPAGSLEAIAEAIRERAGPVIEVRRDRWDGETYSPLSGACRGVISGFGALGVREALRVFSEG